MKKITPFIIIGILFIAILIIFNIGKKTYKEINLDTIETKINNKETFIIYIGSSTCAACQRFKPTLNQVINDHNLTVYYIDVNKLSEKEYAKFLTVINFGESTPCLYFIKDGEYSQYDALKSVKTYTEIVEKMTKLGYIEK